MVKEDYLKQYVIPVNGLSAGIHRYEFEIEKEFFDHIEYSELSDGNIHVDLELIKESNMFTLSFRFEGTVKVSCDRCNEIFDQPVSGNERLIVKSGVKEHDDTDDIVFLSDESGQLDISHEMYEFINLMIPLRRVHPDDENGNSTCDPEVLDKLNEYSKSEKTDPRWDALKKLKNK